VLGNSRAAVSTDDSDSEMQVTGPDFNTVMVGGEMQIVDQEEAVPEPDYQAEQMARRPSSERELLSSGTVG
jgi:hypothetical protein